MTNPKPLVSVVIITFNFEKYIIEALDSVKAQTYDNLELIISDDFSKDKTVSICKEWVTENKDRFKRTQIITVEKNTGVSSNCNRGFNAAKGEWIKPFAGDDILLPNCISRFIDQIEISNNVSFLCSDAEIFGEDGSAKRILSDRIWLDNSIRRIKSLNSYKEQYKEFKIKNMVCAPSAFYRQSAFKSIGGFDEQIKLLEDYPFWIKATRKGHKIFCIDEKLVKYRMNGSSVQANSKYPLAFELVLQKYIFKNIFFGLFINFIDQMHITKKDLLLCKVLKYTSVIQRIIWKLRIRNARINKRI
jgi:alpha-1,3-rhamnosyltransferase